jgi:hypothetical protein
MTYQEIYKEFDKLEEGAEFMVWYFDGKNIVRVGLKKNGVEIYMWCYNGDAYIGHYKANSVSQMFLSPLEACMDFFH